MGSGLKFLLALTTIGTVGFYLARVSEMTEEAQWGFIGFIMAQGLAFVIIPGSKKKTVVKRREGVANLDAIHEEMAEEDEGLDIPEPVQSDPLDGATLRERKMAKIKALEMEDEEEDEDVQEIEIDDIEVEDDVHIAEEYVVEVDAESIEEASIEDTVDQRRRRHAEIRRRIEERRRGQMAEVRASTARMWDNRSVDEDLDTIMAGDDHGLTILEEPADIEAGHPYGTTWVRLDDARVIKVRIALDSGFRAAEVKAESDLPLPLPLPLPGAGLELPPLPGLAPLPPPPLDSQSKLAALREEMD